jgi:hypothetical protein
MECDKMALKNKVLFDIDTAETELETQAQAISTLQGQATAATTHAGLTNNPHGVTPAQIGAATPQDISNAVQAVVTALDWKEMVATFEDLATTYPEPDEGWTASVAADNITYRYDGTNWVGISANAIPVATTNNDGLFTVAGFDKLDGIETGATADQNSAEVNYDNQDSTLLATNVKGALDELDLKKLDATALSASVALYPTDTPADILSPSVKLVTSVEDPDYDVTAVNISTPTLAGTEQLVATLVADAGVLVGNPGFITVSTLGLIRKTVGNANQNAVFYYKIFRYDGDTQTLIATPIAESDPTPIVESATYEEFFAFALLGNGTFAANDRIVIRYYADVVGNDGAVYQFQFGGDNPVRTLLPVPVSVIPAPNANLIVVDTQNFDGLLDGNDDTVQAALDSLDDHDHDGIYYTKDELRPVTGDPEVDDLQTPAVLDGRYPTFEVTDEIIGGVNTAAINLGSLDSRVATLEGEPDPVGGGFLTVYRATIPAANWQQAGSAFFQNVDILPETGDGLTIDYQDNNILQSSITQSNLPGQNMTISSTAQTGPVILTKDGGGVFSNRFLGIEVFANTPTGTSSYVITEILNDNQVEMYYQSWSDEPTETQFTHFLGGNNIIEFAFVANFPGQAFIGMEEEQTQQRYIPEGEVHQGALASMFDVPIIGGRFAQLVTGFSARNNIGRVYLALMTAREYFDLNTQFVFDSANTYINTANGIRRIARQDENGVIYINNAATYGEESWFTPFGNNPENFESFQIASSLAIRINSLNRATESDWAAATEPLPLLQANEIPITNTSTQAEIPVNRWGVAFGLELEPGGDPFASFTGVDISFESPDVFDGDNDIIVALQTIVSFVPSPNFDSAAALEAEWSKVKNAVTTSQTQTPSYIGTLNANQLQVQAITEPTLDLPIVVGVIK